MCAARRHSLSTLTTRKDVAFALRLVLDTDSWNDVHFYEIPKKMMARVIDHGTDWIEQKIYPLLESFYF